ncbi:hypothetical protein F2P81_017977 [Scophthalmus maximus]|uniref:Uncharacterized protein n=1 Tax=Scophthalmus maximus TaxID=52904 RepID=A0A6A4SEB2_SCOMX|nr:hypothetical protein F2P81_017977 [Scophthalmus maximus]
MDWAAQKLTSVTSSLSEQILSHLFSQEELSANTELVQAHRDRISKASNLINVELLWKTYNSRRDLNIDRSSCTFKCPVMLVVGDQAPYEDAAVRLSPCSDIIHIKSSHMNKCLEINCRSSCGHQVECNSKMDPTTTSFLKPAKLTEAFKYFIQGMGYMASSCMTRLSRSRTTSLSSSYSMDGSRSRSRTLSQGSQGGQMPPSPSQTMEVSC